MKQLLLAVAVVLPLFAVWMALAESPTTPEFDRTWKRTDKPIADGQVNRTWSWGPEARTGPVSEQYIEAPGGQRTVQYFDKARMEDNTWRITEPPWDVTTGLLAKELMTGRHQVGDDTFIDRTPAQVNVAGDLDDERGPTYATFGTLVDRPPHAVGDLLSERVSRLGQTTVDSFLSEQLISVAFVDEVTGHGIADPFWDFMNSTGMIWNGSDFVEDALFQNPYLATGRPVTEAYWADLKVGGEDLLVLTQCFERRCLTYTPANDPGWRVEMGNIGLHFYEWKKSGDQVSPTATSPADPTATSIGQDSSPTVVSTGTTPLTTSTVTATTDIPFPTFTSTSLPVPTQGGKRPGPQQWRITIAEPIEEFCDLPYYHYDVTLEFDDYASNEDGFIVVFNFGNERRLPPISGPDRRVVVYEHYYGKPTDILYAEVWAFNETGVSDGDFAEFKLSPVPDCD